MSIIDYLYKGAAPGERVATQQAVKNMPYSQIGKNIFAEGAFGKGSNLRGFDPNFKGGTNLFNYLKGGVTSLFGGKAAGNIGGGTPAQRQLFEKVASSPFSKTMGTAAKTALSASMTAGPTGAYAMYQMNKPSTEAGYDYVRDYDRGSITNAADAENALDYQNFSTGMMNADQNYPGAEQTKSPIAENDLTNYNEHYNMMPEEEKGGIIEYLKNKGSQIKDFAMPALKDAAGRTIASQTLGTAGAMFSPYLGLAGMIFGGLKGGNMFNQPYRSGMNTVDEFGNLISAEDLDKQNALGGYYTDAARASRNRAKSIATFKARGGASTPAGIDRLNKLKAEQKLEETSRQNAFDNAMASGQSFYDNLNQGQGSTAGGVGNTAAEAAESRATAGDDPSYSGPSTFQYGGIVGMYR